MDGGKEMCAGAQGGRTRVADRTTVWGWSTLYVLF